MQDVRQRNTSSPEEEIYEKRNVGFTASYDGLSARRLQLGERGADRDYADTWLGLHGIGACQNAADL